MKIENSADQPSKMECFIQDCPNHSEMLVNGLRFLEFPKDVNKNSAWINSIRIHYSDHPAPQSLSRICNGHFFLKNSDTLNTEHPSYKPIFFPVMTKEAIKELRNSCKEQIRLLQEVKVEVNESSLSSLIRASELGEENVPPKKSKPHLPPKPYRKITSKHRYCCVVGCYNNTSNKEVEFVKFPNRVSHQYKAWIRRIGRVNSDGSLWLPSSDSLICSNHFYDGRLSDMDSIFSTSFAPAFFPHNIDKWDEIRHTLSMRKENGKPSYVSHESDGQDCLGSNGVLLDLDDYCFLNEKVTLTYPSWMNEISEYILDCQQEKKFTDIIISNGQHSFEGHRIILMSALPMIKIALLNLECCELDEKPVIILPDMSAYEIEILEKVIYSRGSLSASQYTLSKHSGGINSSYHTTHEKISDQCPISEAVANKVKKAAGDKKKILAPIPILKLDNKKITSNDFFRLYNNVACRAAKNHALHNTFQPQSSPIAQSNVIEGGSTLGNAIFEDEVVQEAKPFSSAPSDSSAPEEKDKPILDKIMKQVTTMRAVNPRKFTVRNANKKYTVLMQTVKRPDASSKPFPSLEEIKARRSERPSRPYCSACEKEFDTYIERDQHKVSHLSEPDQFPNSLNCKYCKKNFKTVEQKRIHETNHTKIGWKCEICEKGFPSAHKLLDHSFTHKTTSRFMCQFCSKGFRIKSKLILHENMHRNISKHKCKYCLRLFISARSLMDHLNFHEGLRPYVCDKCGKSFCTSPSLSQHRSRVHNRRDFALGRYKCKHCSKRFRYKAVANNHMEHCESRPLSVFHIENV